MATETFFFREAKSPLFASYHTPQGGSVRPACVLLLQPYGHEYIRAHRAFKLLAERLADAGFPTLRFDFRGCGDSGMDAEQVGIDEWREDLRAAAEMCRARSGRRKVAAVGLRLGATLVLLESAEKGNLDSLVLWDPVVSGRGYLDGLAAMHAQLVRSLPGGASAPRKSDPREHLGFHYGEALTSGLEQIDLSTVKAKGAENVLFIETSVPGEAVAPLDVGAARQDRTTVQDVRIWMEDADKALIPQQALQAITGWLQGVYA